MKKILTELTEQELLQQLKEDPLSAMEFSGVTFKDNSIVHSDDITNFVSFYRLKPGKEKVTSHSLYYIYSHWSENSMPFKKFTTELQRFLEKKNAFFLINENAINLSLKALELIEARKVNKTKKKSFKEHFENFLLKYDISAGDKAFEDEFLYYLYDKWSYNINKKNPLGKIQFFKFCQLYFKEKKTLFK